MAVFLDEIGNLEFVLFSRGNFQCRKSAWNPHVVVCSDDCFFMLKISTWKKGRKPRPIAHQKQPREPILILAPTSFILAGSAATNRKKFKFAAN